jgi:hypothetical protein
LLQRLWLRVGETGRDLAYFVLPESRIYEWMRGLVQEGRRIMLNFFSILNLTLERNKF